MRSGALLSNLELNLIPEGRNREEGSQLLTDLPHYGLRQELTLPHYADECCSSDDLGIREGVRVVEHGALRQAHCQVLGALINNCFILHTHGCGSCNPFTCSKRCLRAVSKGRKLPVASQGVGAGPKVFQTIFGSLR